MPASRRQKNRQNKKIKMGAIRLQSQILKEVYVNLQIEQYEIKRKELIKEGRSPRYADRVIFKHMMLNENWMESLSGGVFSGFKSTIAKKLVGWSGTDTNSMMGFFIVNVIENVGVKQLMAVFGDANKCEAITELLGKATMETVIEMGADKIIGFILEKMGEAGAGSVVNDEKIKEITDSLAAAVGIEVINEFVYTLIFEMYIKKISAKLCGKGGEDINIVDTIKQVATGGAEEVAADLAS